ncbi:MAG: mechanosensitive ion channel family protein [Leptospira sp.]|nr:mechanosensitive ion channel family protein [Leptospira sp.]
MKFRNILSILFVTILFSGSSLIAQDADPDKPTLRDKPLAGVKTDNPRDTMRTFMNSMQEYKDAKVNSDLPRSKEALNRAIRTLDLEDIPFMVRKEKGEEAARFLKEAIDRVIIINYDYIPDNEEGEPKIRWRLKDTEITIIRVESGERAGEYLFSKDTVFRSREFYDKVSHLPFLEGSGHGALYEPPFLEETVPPWSKEIYLELAIWQWIGIGVSLMIGITFRIISKGLLTILYKLATKSKTDWDQKIIQAISSPVGYIVSTGFWYFSLKFLKLEGIILSVLTFSLQILLSAYIVWLLYSLANVFSEFLIGREGKDEKGMNKQIANLVTRTIKSFIVVFGVLITIQNMGINVMSLLAGLGIGGLAFALAAKDTAANLFGSIMILIDRPFKVGDWIKIGSSEGTVEEIGLRSTRIRTFYDSVISIPNMDMAVSPIDNLGQRTYRRILANLGITYGTPPAKIEAFLEGIKNIIKANPHTRKENYHVVFNKFGDFNLDIMVYVFLKVPDWATELVARQNIYLEIIRLAEDLGIEFAFPTQTLHIDSTPEKAKPGSKIPSLDDYKSIPKVFGPGGNKALPEGGGLFIPPYKE